MTYRRDEIFLKSVFVSHSGHFAVKKLYLFPPTAAAAAGGAVVRRPTKIDALSSVKNVEKDRMKKRRGKKAFKTLL